MASIPATVTYIATCLGVPLAGSKAFISEACAYQYTLGTGLVHVARSSASGSIKLYSPGQSVLLVPYTVDSAFCPWPYSLDSSGVTCVAEEFPDKVQNFQDGMVLGWGVAGAIIAVYVIRRVFR